ncbi:uncharacterized protein LOC122967594 [Thunnus albacares]|uniref:uncharacterized protein LOC122967594 n=1 Tax=Thunnus albacares TaxID=8236 RepID=UPI001CF71BAF|nr:uncharacterized protein LOC122967594 [Thunnus albacares]
MGNADKLIDQIFSFVDLQNESAEKLNNLASDLEEYNKNINVSKVVGSSLSVGGATALTVAGLTAILTGGAAIPFLATAGSLASGLGLATNITSDVVDAVKSTSAIQEAKQISEKIQNLEKEIQELTGSLVKEAEKSCSDVPPEDYVVDQILRKIAKRNGLKLNDKINVLTLVSDLSVKKMFEKDKDFGLLQKSALELPLLSEFVTDLTLKEIAIAGTKKAQRKVMRTGVTKVATSMGLTASKKAIRRVGGGAVGLLFSVPELIGDLHNLDNCKTEASQSLREMAEAIQTTSEEMKRELDEIEELCQKIADMKCWKKYARRSSRKRRLRKMWCF